MKLFNTSLLFTYIFFANALALGLIVIAGCGSNADSVTVEELDFSESCDNYYQEPVLFIAEVIDKNTGENIETVQISELYIDGQLADFENQIVNKVISADIDRTNDILTCYVPCGFSQIETTYDFKMSAENYQELEVKVAASYAIFRGGCPLVFDRGTRAYFELEPE